MIGICQGETEVPLVLPMAGWFRGLRNAAITAGLGTDGPGADQCPPPPRFKRGVQRGPDIHLRSRPSSRTPWPEPVEPSRMTSED